MQQRASGPITTSVASVIAAQELEISIREVHTQFYSYLIYKDEKYRKEVSRLKERTELALANAEKEAFTPAEQAIMKRVRQGYIHFFDEYESTVKSLSKKEGQDLDPLAALMLRLKIMELVEQVLMKEILEPAHEYLRLNEGMLTQATATNEQLAQRLTVGLVALGVFGSVGGLLAGWVIASAVRRTILQTEEQLRTTAEQLTRAVPASDQVPGVGEGSLERVAASVSAVLRRLEKTERDALRAEQLASVGQMAAGVAHEVRNPLAAIKLLVQAAGDRGGIITSRDLRVLEEEIARLEQLVSGLLDFARPPRPDVRPIEVLPLVEQVVEAVRPRAEAQGVELSVTAVPSVCAAADPNQLRQVLYNLLFNALDTQPAGGHIRVRIGNRDHDGGLVLTVEDGGPGLPPGLGDRIFEPFVSTKETGVGLGLSVCRRIAESHGGTLTAATLQTGTVFTLSIPPARHALAPVLQRS